jgi:hypothetical protein
MLAPDLYLSHKVLFWLRSNLVPMWFRNKWPVRNFGWYWQKEDFERADKQAKKIAEFFKNANI